MTVFRQIEGLPQHPVPDNSTQHRHLIGSVRDYLRSLALTCDAARHQKLAMDGLVDGFILGTEGKLLYSKTLGTICTDYYLSFP